MGDFTKIAQGGVNLFAGAMATDSKIHADAANANELERVARLEDANAVDSLSRGSLLAGQARMRGSQVIGKQRVAYANSGVDVSVGTPVDVAGGTRLFSEMDAQTLVNNAAREAYGHEQVGIKYRAQKQQVENDLSAQQTALPLNAVGSLLGMAGGLVG